MKTRFDHLTLAALLLLASAALHPAPAQSPSTRQLTVLYDNTSALEECRADWGFACLVEGWQKKILFDTGTRSDILFHNVERLNVDLGRVELVVISHAHEDHTGGLPDFLTRFAKLNIPVYLPYSSPQRLIDAVAGAGAQAMRHAEPVVLCDNAQLTGELTRPIPEQALILSSSRGLILVTGCAHPGIVEMLERVKETRNEPIDLVLGGFHLYEHSEPEIENIIERFRSMGVRRVGATHCTGDRAIAMMRKAYGANFVELGVGRVISLR